MHSLLFVFEAIACESSEPRQKGGTAIGGKPMLLLEREGSSSGRIMIGAD